jgi:glutamyl-tRNA reductase
VQQLVIHHQQGKSQDTKPLENAALTWTTCLRRVDFFFTAENERSAILPTSEGWFRGEMAWQFLLEILSGIHSPVFGETEVLGQYRKFIEETKTQTPSEMKSILEELLADAKKIRTQHLQGNGRQTYGSVVEKWLDASAEETVHLWGTGVLAEKLIPWLTKKRKLKLYSRDPKNNQKRFTEPLVPVFPIDSLKETSGLLIIAAPIEAEHIQEVLGQNPWELIIDLRDNSASDFFNEKWPVKKLSDLFNEIKTHDQKKELLRAEIVQTAKCLTQKRLESFEKRRQKLPRLVEVS